YPHHPSWGDLGGSLLLMEKPDVLPVCRDACRKPVRPADSLKSRRDISEIQVRIIAAVAADELIVIGVAAFGTAFPEVDRLTSQDHGPPQRRLIMDLHGGSPRAIARTSHRRAGRPGGPSRRPWTGTS